MSSYADQYQQNINFNDINTVDYILSGLPDLKPEPICCFSSLLASYAFLPAVPGLELGLHQPTIIHKPQLFDINHKLIARTTSCTTITIVQKVWQFSKQLPQIICWTAIKHVLGTNLVVMSNPLTLTLTLTT